MEIKSNPHNHKGYYYMVLNSSAILSSPAPFVSELLPHASYISGHTHNIDFNKAFDCPEAIQMFADTLINILAITPASHEWNMKLAV